MNFENLATFSGPGIYIFYRGDKILYIGATTRGLSRCLSRSHPMGKHFDDVTIGLQFIPTKTRAEAFELEAELIQESQPEFNCTHNDQHRRYRMKLRAERAEAAADGVHYERVQPRERAIRWKPSDALVDAVNVDMKEQRVLKRVHLPCIKKDWPDARIIKYLGTPIVYCGEQNGDKVYYNRKRDSFVLSKDDALLLD